MSVLDEVFMDLLRAGLVSSHNEFSSQWIRKSHRYMSVIRATGKQPSIDALVHLAATIRHKQQSENISANVLAEAEGRVWRSVFEQAAV